MPMRPPRSRRARRAGWVVAVAFAIVVGGCAGSSAPAPSGTTDAGFPLGSFSKELTEPIDGHVRVVWTFAPDGRFTEVQFALDFSDKLAHITPRDGQWEATYRALQAQARKALAETT